MDGADYVIVPDLAHGAGSKAGPKALTFVMFIEMINMATQNCVTAWETARKKEKETQGDAGAHANGANGTQSSTAHANGEQETETHGAPRESPVKSQSTPTKRTARNVKFQQEDEAEKENEKEEKEKDGEEDKKRGRAVKSSPAIENGKTTTKGKKETKKEDEKVKAKQEEEEVKKGRKRTEKDSDSQQEASGKRKASTPPTRKSKRN